MPLVAVAEAIVVGEELFIITAETLPETADLRISACVVLPELLYRRSSTERAPPEMIGLVPRCVSQRERRKLLLSS
jgi:hypothetical protein